MLTIGLAGLGFLWTLDRACERVPVSTIAAVYPLQIVVSAVLAPMLLAAEAPGKRALLGTALVLGAAALAVAPALAARRA